MKFELAGLSVMICMPTHRDLPPQTVCSMLETQHELLARGIPFEFQMQVGGSLVHHSRTKCAHLFLKSECNRLFWIDSDIVWSPQDFCRLLAMSTKMECVSAIYPSKSDPADFYLRCDDINAPIEANEFGCLPLKGLGLGFTVVHRKVIEELSEKAPKRKINGIDELIPSIFRLDHEGDEERGEDMAFFSDVRALGYKVHLDPAISLGHIGPKEYRADFMGLLKATPPKELAA
jgi:hypothetical protein